MTTLSSDTKVSLGADVDGHDIVSVMILISGDVLGSAVDLATSEEFLGVGRWVENNSKGGSEVGNASALGEVDVLSRVNGSVPVDVLEVVVD